MNVGRRFAPRGGSQTGGLDGLTRNGRTISAGITGRLQPE